MRSSDCLHINVELPWPAGLAGIGVFSCHGHRRRCHLHAALVCLAFVGCGIVRLPRLGLWLNLGTGQGQPLLGHVMQGGQRVASPPSLEDVRRYARLSLTQLPAPLRRIDRADPYDVRIAPALTELAEQVDLHT